jgi:hypothetical protein
MILNKGIYLNRSDYQRDLNIFNCRVDRKAQRYTGQKFRLRLSRYGKQGGINDQRKNYLSHFFTRRSIILKLGALLMYN